MGNYASAFRGQNTWRPLSMLQKLEVNLLGWGFKILREILFLPFPDPRLCLGCSVGDIVSMDGLDVFHKKKKKNKDIVPEFKFSLDQWDPKTGSGFISEVFRTIKMDKADRFFKVQRSLLVEPIFIILKMIQIAGYFPKSMRKSKLTFLPKRSIFSLDPLTKIVESVLSKSFGECL